MIFYTDGRSSPRLERPGVAAMAETLAAAFMAHDNWIRVVPRPAARRTALRALFGFMGAAIDRHGHVVVAMADGRPVGYVTFMEDRDAKGVTFGRVVGAGGFADALRFLAALRPRELLGMRALERAVARFERGRARDPACLHLHSAGVLPEWKGRGLMKAAFRYAETRFAALGFSAYRLETTDPANLPVYAAFGLERVGEEPLGGSGRMAYFLERRFGERPFSPPG